MQEEDVWLEFEQWRSQLDSQVISLVVIDASANLAWFSIGANEMMFAITMEGNAVKVKDIRFF